MPTRVQSFPSKQPRGYEYSNLRYWSIITAYGLAAAEKIVLTPLHLELLDWLRQDFFKHGSSSIIRLVLRIEDEFAEQGGILLLMSLFPKGPLQALKIAGLPVQRNAANYPVSLH